MTKPKLGAKPKPVYSAELSADIENEFCSLLVSLPIKERSLRSICSRDGMPSIKTICRWLHDRPEFAAKYREARVAQSEMTMDEIRDLAQSEPERLPSGAMDSASVTHIRNQVSSLQWLAEKLAPKVYGPKIDVASEVHLTTSITDTEAARQIEAIFTAAAARKEAEGA